MAWSGAVFVLAMIWSNPLYLVLLLALEGAGLHLLSPAIQWRGALILSLFPAAFFCIVNALVSPAGSTVLIAWPREIRLEPLLFGLSAGLRIILAVTSFCFLGAFSNRDDLFCLSARFAPKSSLLAGLVTLMIPRMARDLERIRAMMSIRGASFDGGLMARIRASRPLLHALLLSSLDGAWDTATALHCRAFDSGRRSHYSRRRWSRRDTLLAAPAAAACALGALPGVGRCTFYPSLTPLVDTAALPLFAATLCLLAAAVLLSARASR